MKKVSAEVAESKFYARADVFAAAVTAQRKNGEYVKRYSPQANPLAPKSSPNDLKLPNGTMMKAILSSDRSDITSEDYERGEQIRQYFCSMITLVFEGTAKAFIRAAVEAATTEEIPEVGPMIMLVASLPSIYERNIKRNVERDELSNITQNSIPLDQAEGETVKLNVTVLDSIYKERYNSNAVNVMVNNMLGNRVLFFFDRKNWVKGNKYNLSGRIKKKGNQTTQLHYVRQLIAGNKDKEN